MTLQKRKIEFDSEYFPHYYLCTYVPKSRGGDLLSQSLLHFKDGRSPHHQAWSECAYEELRTVRELKQGYVIRALGHLERTADDGPDYPINKLGSLVSRAVGGTYQAGLLAKIRDTKRLSTSSFTREEREQEMKNAYQFTSPDRHVKHILILDDILTTGSTIRAIIAAVLKACPSVDISVFTLAHTRYAPETNLYVELKSNRYTWMPNEGWMIAAEDAPEYATHLGNLKRLILNDSFGA